jgi:TetR/AcrR family transcriptional regulator
MKKRNPDATRKALLDAAEAVILEKGFGNAPLSEIAKRANITKSLIHHYFGTKQNLWQEVKKRRFTLFAESMMGIIETATPTPDLMRTSIDLFFQFLKANKDIVRMLSRIFMEDHSGDRLEKIVTLNNMAKERFRMAQKAGFLRNDLDPGLLLVLIIGLVHQWFQNKEHFIYYFGIDKIVENSDAPATKGLDEAYLEVMFKILFEGIMPT